VFYRRKILLALLQILGGKVDKIKYQKLLFLLNNNQAIPSFDFIPYKYGCFSFQSYADLRTMAKYGYVKENKNSSNGSWEKVDKKNYLQELLISDLSELQLIKKRFGKCSTSDLIKFTYTNFPYYAIKSTICNNYLDEDELKRIEEIRPQIKHKILFTIGYEGITLEKYLNKLIRNDIKVLCDVRKNPLSMKYGFSKNQLKNACEGIGIIYTHLPRLGIESKKRQCLVTQFDYDILFEEYRNTTLISVDSELQKLFSLMKINSRIALTCFEANINQCHRKLVAEKLTTLPRWKYEVRHI
jgi:uncharacterized protein (DUF488 family)